MLYKRALAIGEKTIDADDTRVATALSNLGSLYHKKGRYADAELLHKRALAFREKALGPEHPDVATSLNNLAALYVDQGRYADAEPLYKRSLAIKERALDTSIPTSQRRSVTWLHSTSIKDATPMPSCSTSGPWRFAKRHLVPSIPMLPRR